MFGRVILSVLALSTLAVVGCERAGHPDRNRLGEGVVASVFANDTSAVEVKTRPGNGLGGGDKELLRTGATVMVMSDTGDESDESRPVWASVLEGRPEGKVVSIPRNNLRVRR